jgi:hypothetical protein
MEVNQLKKDIKNLLQYSLYSTSTKISVTCNKKDKKCPFGIITLVAPNLDPTTDIMIAVFFDEKRKLKKTTKKDIREFLGKDNDKKIYRRQLQKLLIEYFKYLI